MKTTLYITSLLLCACAQKIYVPSSTTIEYVDREVLRDTTIYVDLVRQEFINVTQSDSSFLENLYSYTQARIDTLGQLHHTLRTKYVALPITVQYKDRLITRDSVVIRTLPPQVVKEIKHRYDKTFWLSVLLNVLLCGWITRKFWLKIL